MTIISVDVGESMVGVLSERGRYVPYYGTRRKLALKRIARADVVVTYNGKAYDLPELGRLAGLQNGFPLQGTHIDMRSIRWSDRIWGSNLIRTYKEHFKVEPEIPSKYDLACRNDRYEASNWQDCYMALNLFKVWKAGELLSVDTKFRDHSIDPN